MNRGAFQMKKSDIRVTRVVHVIEIIGFSSPKSDRAYMI